MKMNLLKKLVAGAALFAASLAAQAAPVKWELDNVTFTDGSAATGSFTIDYAAQIWWDFSISTTGGSLSAFNYDPGNSIFSFNGWGPNSFLIMAGDGHRYLTFSFADALGDAGGTHAINTLSSWECMNCNPWRYMSGSVTTERADTDVPEPATLALFLPAVGMIGLVSRRRRKPLAA